MALIGAAIGVGTALIGGAMQSSSSQSAANAQYKYDKKVYEFNWEETLKDYEWALQRNQVDRDNYAAEANYRYQTAIQDWRYQLAIADQQDRMNIKAYTKSLETYGLQRSFNNMAAAAAYASEQRKIQDAVTEISFQNQDVVIQALQESGNLQARGVSGRSAGKALYSVVAAAGRNQAILAASLASAQGNFRQANDKIAADKFGADLTAWGNLMVRPEKAIRPAAPLAPPIPTILDPRKPSKPPKPQKGAASNPWPSTIASIGSTLAGVNWKSL